MFQGTKNQPRKKNIFISYREKDTAGETGRLVDMLKQYFYEDQIFMDIDKIEPGVDFTDVINNSLEACDVMLAVIGPNWVWKNSATGKSRIQESNDWVRQEIATALARKIRVVPVLVDGAGLPSADELPEDLHPLINRQAYEISNKRWRYDTENLVAFLEKSLGIPTRNASVKTPVKTTKSSVSNILKYGLIGLGILFVILVIFYATVGDESKKTFINPNIGLDTTVVEPHNNPQPEHAIDPRPAPSPIDKPQVETANVEGIWHDNNGLYYLEITQNSNQVEVYSYSIAGQKTGEGVGTVKGRKLNFKITVVNAGILSAETTLSNNNAHLNGTLTIENNGAKYTEPLVLNKEHGND